MLGERKHGKVWGQGHMSQLLPGLVFITAEFQGVKVRVVLIQIQIINVLEE